MGQFTVDKNVRVSINSSVNAAYKQRFFVERQSTTKPGWWEGMGNRVYNGGESVAFFAFSEITIWKITCQNDNNGKGWRDSIERLYGAGTAHITLSCNDDNDGDDDFNDIVVQVSLGSGIGGSLSGIVSDDPNVDEKNDKLGDGDFREFRPKFHDKWVPKKNGDHEP